MATVNCDEVRGMLGAYVLNALGSDERLVVDEHLELCPKCLAEMQAYARALQRLAAAAPTRPVPAAIKPALLKRASREQLERAGASIASAAAKQTLLARLMRWLRSGAAVPRAALGALGLVLLLAIGGLSYRVTQLTQQRAAQEQALALLTDTSAVTVNLRGRPAAPAAKGRIRYKPDGTIGVLETWDLPVLEANRVYQLWLIYPDNTRDTGALFKIVNADGSATIVVLAPRPFNNYVHFGISIEPDGGSPRPTGPGALSSRA
jgi:anti-sigma-K factor RskA